MTEQLEMFILCGGPGSGKSTWSQNLVNGSSRFVRICPDDNRRAIGGDSNNQAVSYPAFCMAKDQVNAALGSGKSVVFDATNMYRKARKDFITIGRSHKAHIKAVIFECNKQTLLARNAERGAKGGRNVEEAVIDKMLTHYERPDLTEFDSILFVSKLP
jgi:predicted kinase